MKQIASDAQQIMFEKKKREKVKRKRGTLVKY